jgi:hypothetical protein
MKKLLTAFILFSAYAVYAQSYIEKPVQLRPAETFHVNSVTSLTGSTRKLIQFQLPPNTVRWYYSFSAFRNAKDVSNVQEEFNLLSKLSHVIDVSGTTAGALAFLGRPPGSNNCDVYLLNSDNDVRLFEAKQNNFYYCREGSMDGLVSGVMEIKDPDRMFGTQSLGFRNNDLSYGIDVKLQIVAIVRTEATINGWTKEQKELLFNKFKDGLIKNGINTYLTSQELGSFVGCILQKLTSSYTPKQIQEYANYELTQILTDMEKKCDQELGLHLEEKKAQNK